VDSLSIRVTAARSRASLVGAGLDFVRAGLDSLAEPVLVRVHEASG
jgi:hypothetical protein